MIRTIKPKLIILNGPLGIGKSTIAKRYAEEHPLTLLLDIDNVWSMISDWREQKEISAPLSKKMAIEMACIHLQAGHDVIIPQIIQSSELAISFENTANDCEADYYEILLFAEKAESIQRFIERGKSQGHPTGFRTGGIIDSNGREEKLATMYDAMMSTAATRPNTIKLEPTLGDIDSTYTALIESIK